MSDVNDASYQMNSEAIMSLITSSKNKSLNLNNNFDNMIDKIDNHQEAKGQTEDLKRKRVSNKT